MIIIVNQINNAEADKGAINDEHAPALISASAASSDDYLHCQSHSACITLKPDTESYDIGADNSIGFYLHNISRGGVTPRFDPVLQQLSLMVSIISWLSSSSGMCQVGVSDHCLISRETVTQ